MEERRKVTVVWEVQESTEVIPIFTLGQWCIITVKVFNGLSKVSWSINTGDDTWFVPRVNTMIINRWVLCYSIPIYILSDFMYVILIFWLLNKIRLLLNQIKSFNFVTIYIYIYNLYFIIYILYFIFYFLYL